MLLLRSAYGFVLAMVWGALWGSFANVCIYRIPRRESLSRPSSHCPHCIAPIAFYDNIPVLGWLRLRGRCRNCRASISPRYLAVELFAIVLSAIFYARFVAWGALGGSHSFAMPGPPAVAMSHFIVYFFFGGVLLVLSAIDIEHQILPDRITYPAIPVFFLLGRLLYFQSPSSGVSLGQALAGLVAGYLVVRLISDGYYYLTGREGLGYGDGKLLSLIGALLGWKALPYTLLIGSLSGLLVGVPIAVLRRHSRRGTLKSDPQNLPPLRHASVVFGPFLAFGATLYLLFLLGKDTDSLLLQTLGTLFGEEV